MLSRKSQRRRRGGGRRKKSDTHFMAFADKKRRRARLVDMRRSSPRKIGMDVSREECPPLFRPLPPPSPLALHPFLIAIFESGPIRTRSTLGHFLHVLYILFGHFSRFSNRPSKSLWVRKILLRSFRAWICFFNLLISSCNILYKRGEDQLLFNSSLGEKFNWICSNKREKSIL